MKKIIKDLEYFKPIEKENYVELKLPVAIKMFKSCLLLRIIPMKDGFAISDDGFTFYDFNEDSNYYFDLFMEKDENYHYDIKLNGNFFYKKYPSNYNINVAINEFIRFFINLDDFIKKNNIT